MEGGPVLPLSGRDARTVICRLEQEMERTWRRLGAVERLDGHRRLLQDYVRPAHTSYLTGAINAHSLKISISYSTVVLIS